MCHHTNKSIKLPSSVQLCEKKVRCHMHPYPDVLSGTGLCRHKFKCPCCEASSMPGKWHSSRICAFQTPPEGSVVISSRVMIVFNHPLTLISVSQYKTVSISINSVQLDACQCFERTNFTNFKTECRV
jgi:hypothetical protein